MDTMNYYQSPEHVMLFDPIERLLVKLGLPKEWFIARCMVCNRIPSELYGTECKECRHD